MDSKARPRIVWHYTSLERFRGYAANGRIEKTLESNRDSPAVWLVAEGSPPRTKEECDRAAAEHDAAGGLVRISVPIKVALEPWHEYCLFCGFSDDFKTRRERGLAAKGIDPQSRYAALKEVPIFEWLAVEHWVDGAWQPLTMPK